MSHIVGAQVHVTPAECIGSTVTRAGAASPAHFYAGPAEEAALSSVSQQLQTPPPAAQQLASSQQLRPQQLLTRGCSSRVPPPASRRYRIKRQSPGCCYKCNNFYGGCCDRGANCGGCNAAGCCDRPRVIYIKEEYEESPRRSRRFCC